MIVKRFKELRLKDAELPMGVVPKKPTNADRIRSMSNEELDCFLNKVTYGTDECPYEYGSERALEWLQQPAKETER